MTLIQPVSSLSIKRAVNLYTIILFISFGSLLYWLASDRYQTFIDSHQDAARNVTRVTAFEINKTHKDKHRLIEIFLENSKSIISALVNNPDNSVLHQKLTTSLKKYQSDFHSYRILSLSDVAAEDIDSNVDTSCANDLMYFKKNSRHLVHMLAEQNTHHYHMVNQFSVSNSEYLFCISFNIDEISDLLSSIQPIQHTLMLVNRDAHNLIEVSSFGNMSGVRMTGSDSFRELSSTGVKGTNWSVVDLHDDGLFTNYRERILIEYLVAYYIFSIIILLMRNILINQDKRRTTAEEQLQKNHRQIINLNNQLELLSRTDSLTGLYNRRYFDEMIQQEWNRGLRSKNPISCILLDIDYFKNYNDSYGHQAGDKCLKNISLVMKDTFRRAGDIVARYGGEEFIVIMSDTTIDDAKSAITLFQRELEKLQIPHNDSDVSEFVTISAGLVNQMPSQDTSIDEFIRKADKALYQAKDAGRNQWLMHQE